MLHQLLPRFDTDGNGKITHAEFHKGKRHNRTAQSHGTAHQRCSTVRLSYLWALQGSARSGPSSLRTSGMKYLRTLTTKPRATSVLCASPCLPARPPARSPARSPARLWRSAATFLPPTSPFRTVRDSAQYQHSRSSHHVRIPSASQWPDWLRLRTVGDMTAIAVGRARRNAFARCAVSAVGHWVFTAHHRLVALHCRSTTESLFTQSSITSRIATRCVGQGACVCFRVWVWVWVWVWVSACVRASIQRHNCPRIFLPVPKSC